MRDSMHGSGDSLGTYILLGGGGCLLVVLALGLLATWGTCAAGSAVVEGVQSSGLELAAPAQAFLDATGRGAWDDAWAMTSPGLRERVPRDAFEAWVREHGDLLVGGTARALEERQGGPRRRLLTVSIERANTQVGVVTFTLLRPEGGRGPAAGYLIDDLHGGRPDPALEEQRVIHALLLAHLRQMSAGDFEAAAVSFPPDGGARQGFLLWAGLEGERFRGALPLLDPALLRGDRAEVRVTLRDPPTRQLRPGEVRSTLERGAEERWWITAAQVETPPAP